MAFGGYNHNICKLNGGVKGTVSRSKGMRLLLSTYFGVDLLCGFTGTVLGPGFGALGFFLGVGEGVDLLCGFTGTVFAMIFNY